MVLYTVSAPVGNQSAPPQPRGQNPQDPRTTQGREPVSVQERVVSVAARAAEAAAQAAEAAASLVTHTRAEYRERPRSEGVNGERPAGPGVAAPNSNPTPTGPECYGGGHRSDRHTTYQPRVGNPNANCPVCEGVGHGADRCPGARPWPPPAATDGNRFWYARGHPSLPDGVHVLPSLENRGVDPCSEVPTGILKGFATVEPVCRRGSSSGVGSSVIHWE